VPSASTLISDPYKTVCISSIGLALRSREDSAKIIVVPMVLSRLRAWSRGVLFEHSKAAVSGDIAQHLRLCRGSISLVYVGETDDLVWAPTAVPTFWMPTVAAPGNFRIADPEATLARKGDRLLLYAPMSLFGQWMSMPEDVERMLEGRKLLTIVLLLPGLVMERVQDFRWILSALLDHFPHRHRDLVLTFSPGSANTDMRYIVAERVRRLSWLTSPTQTARWMKQTMRSALSYDSLAGVKGDPDRFAALLISIRPSPGRPV
jgi:hypothetical protein